MTRGDRRRRILIVRLSALGDTALTLPLLWAVRDAMPDAFVGWVVGERASPLLEPFAPGEPPRPGGIDRLHVWRRSERSPGGILRLAREITHAAYDVSLDAQCLTKSALIPFLARIPERVGFARFPMGGRELSTRFNNTLLPEPGTKHIVTQALGLAGALGVDIPQDQGARAPGELRGRMRIDLGALRRMRAWWRGRGLGSPPAGGDPTAVGERTVVFGVGAGWPTKVLPVETVAALAAEARSRGRRCVVIWGPAESKDLPRWSDVFGEAAVIGPRTDVNEMTALLCLAERYAGPDSAGLHLSWLLGIPTFSWFGASDPERCAPRPLAGESPGKHVHVVKGLPCRPCWKRRCRAPSCVRELSAEEILPAFREWLET